MSQEQNNEVNYKVLVNDEEQYSLWPDFKQIPLGWRDTGTQGSKEICLNYVNEVWTDMRPKSLREAMEKSVKKNKKV